MKRFFLFVCCFFIVNTSTIGQVTKESYEKAVDYLDCKVLEIIFSQTDKEEDFKAQCPCDSNITAILLDEFLKNHHPIEVKNTELHEEIKAMKAQTSNSKRSIVEATNYLSTQVFKEKNTYNKIFNFAKTREANSPLFKKLQNELPIYLPKILKNEAPAKLKATPPPPPNDPPLPEPDSHWLAYAIAIFSLLAVFILAFLVNRKIKFLQDQIGELYGNLADKSTSEKSRPSGQSVSDISQVKTDIQGINSDLASLLKDYAVLKSLKGRLEILEDEVKLHDQILQRRQPEKEERSNNTSTTPKISPNISTGEILYLSTPNKDGSFGMSSASSSFKEGASVYRFERHGDIAYFQLDERESATESAMRRPEIIVNPVCRSVNSKSSSSTRIVTQTRGKARLVDDRWIVDESDKAVIRYEG